MRGNGQGASERLDASSIKASCGCNVPLLWFLSSGVVTSADVELYNGIPMLGLSVHSNHVVTGGRGVQPDATGPAALRARP